MAAGSRRSLSHSSLQLGHIASMHAPRQQQRQPPRRRRPPPTALLLVTTVLLGAATTVTSFSFLPWPSLRLHSPASTLGWGGAGPSMQQRRQQRRPTAGARRGRRAVAWMKLKFEPGEDYYGRLGIEVNASLNDIKRAYRCVRACVCVLDDAGVFGFRLPSIGGQRDPDRSNHTPSHTHHRRNPTPSLLPAG